MTDLSWFEDYGNPEFLGYDLSKLGIDQAYLTPVSEDETAFSMYKRHKECIECPYRRIPHKNGNPQILDRASQYFYSVFSVDAQNNNSKYLCNLTTNFGEFGIYKLHVNKENCWVNVVKSPISITFPILTVTLIYCCIFAVIFGIITAWNGITKPKKELVTEQVKKVRVKSLDTFRGISIVIMIFVNFGCGKYEFIEHSIWNGLHVADLVFPWFMWIMGACIPISLTSSFKRQTPKFTLFKNVLLRSIKLFCIGIFLGSGIYLDNLRLFGVLQRFGVCYLAVTVICIFFMDKTVDRDNKESRKIIFLDIIKLGLVWIIIFGIFIVHCLVLFLVADTSCPKGYLGPGGWHKNGSYFNCTGGATGYIDRLILGKHMYQNPTIRGIYQAQPFDPEGILGCLTSIVQVFFGVQAGMILLVHKKHTARLIRWLIWAVITGLIGGCLCGFSKENGLIPINKNLWSISFVLVTSSFAFTLLSVCYFLVDVKKWWSGKPFLYAGMNAIIMYIGHGLTYNNFPVRWFLHSGQTHNTHFIALFENVWGTVIWVLVSYYLYKINYFFTL